MKISKVGIILKHDSSEPRQIGSEMADWFRQREIEAVIDRIEADMDILVILGGDGTLLHVAEQASRLKIPVVGVNLGSLGFLTEVEVGNRYEAIEEIMTGSVGGMVFTPINLLIGAVLMETAIVMVLLSRILDYRWNRITNIISGIIHTLAVCASTFVGTPGLYYVFFGSIEVITTISIVAIAWKWKET